MKINNREGYTDYWPILSWWIRIHRADGRCECRGECGSPHGFDGENRCPEMNGEPGIHVEGVVMLTVAHLDHEPENVDALPSEDSNLKAMCQTCHLRYDVGRKMMERQGAYHEDQKQMFKS